MARVTLASVLVLMALPAVSAQNTPPAEIPLGATKEVQEKWGWPDPSKWLDNGKALASESLNKAKDAAKKGVASAKAQAQDLAKQTGDLAKAAKDKALQKGMASLGLCPKIKTAITDHKDEIATAGANALASMPGDPSLDPKACSGALSTATYGGISKNVKNADNKVAKEALMMVIAPAATQMCQDKIAKALKSSQSLKATKPDQYKKQMQAALKSNLNDSLLADLSTLCPSFKKKKKKKTSPPSPTSAPPVKKSSGKWLVLGSVFGEGEGAAHVPGLGLVLFLIAFSGYWAQKSLRGGANAGMPRSISRGLSAYDEEAVGSGPEGEE